MIELETRLALHASRHGQHNNGTLNSGTPPSPLSSRHSSQDSLHKNNLSGQLGGLPIGHLSSSHLQHMQANMSPATAAAVAAAQKKKGIKSSLGRFFSKKEKVHSQKYQFFKTLRTFRNARFFFVQIKGKDTSMPGDVPGMGGHGNPDPDYGDNVSVAGTLGGKSDFDRRKKKRCDIVFSYLLYNSRNVRNVIVDHKLTNYFSSKIIGTQLNLNDSF